ncbi:MAG: hypothetical protein J6K42_01695 [Clostridia bacterium]|nr:hypothetical protein [Clostridia bacterium]
MNGKTATQLNKEWERQQRKKALNDKYPGIINKIDDWNEKFEKIPTVVKGDIEIKYDKLYSEIKKEYKKFLRSSKIENGIADKINELVCEGEKIINEVYNDIDKKKNNEWYITKEIKDWCYRDREKNKVTIDFLKQDGIINWKSSCRIYEKNLVNKIIEKLKLKFNGVSQILIQRYNESNNTIVINIVDGNRYVAGINLECQYNCFLSEFGNIIFEGEGYTNEKNFVIRNSKIIDRFSINKAILNFRYLLDKNNVKIYKWDIEYNEIAFLDDDKFIIVGAKEFVNNFRMCTFKRILSQEDVNNILKYLKNSGKKIGKEE